jgi:hypothetical protein
MAAKNAQYIKENAFYKSFLKIVSSLENVVASQSNFSNERNLMA